MSEDMEIFGQEDNPNNLHDDSGEEEIDEAALIQSKFNKSSEEEEGPEIKVMDWKSYRIVDPESGQFKTIQDAINSVPEGETTMVPIHINSALYKEKITIINKSVSLEVKDLNSEVYISGEKGATIYIDNDPQYKVEIRKLKLSFKGTPTAEATQDRPSTGESKAQESQDESIDCSTLSDCYKQYRSTIIGDDSHCIIKLKRGSLAMIDCNLNLDLIVKNFKNDITSITVLEDGYLEMVSSEVRGKIDVDCLGLYVDRGNVKMKDILFRDFKKGAVIFNSKKENKNLIDMCTVTYNKTVGIMLLGDNKQTLIRRSQIERNECPGIQIMPGNKSIIRENKIHVNTHGIKIKSADPVISQNEITENYRCGIKCGSVKTNSTCNGRARGESVSLPLTPLIIYNKIVANKEHGVHCYGQNNYSKICKNEILNNSMCGVKTQTEATPLIKENIISSNNCQGILLVEESWATIIGNKIFENCKANIALGGNNSSNTFISGNEITRGLAEGIFIIKSARVTVFNNTIEQNQDGVILAESHAELKSNRINHNAKHGIFLLQNSKPTVLDNTIKNNKNAGIYVKGRTELRSFRNNTVSDNNIGLFLDRKINNINEFKEMNKNVQGNIEKDMITPTVNCTLI
jgi:parallel beta-helix repeat protein